MKPINRVLNTYFSGRLKEIDRFHRSPAEVQKEQLDYMIRMGCDSAFGKMNGLANVRCEEDFRKVVSVTDYESFAPLIDRSRSGEDSVLWPTQIKWYAKSSGTTDAKSKYIPVSEEGLKQCHMQGPRDVLAFFFHNFPENKLLSGKTLTLGGSKRIEREGENAFTGDLSAILIENTPWYANLARVPSVKTALISAFEEKIDSICRETVDKNITAFAGVPSWNLVLMNKVLEYTGKDNLLEVWPNLELFIHGGVNFRPYREQYLQLIPSPDMKYMETYNASEGFFAIGDDFSRDDMLLMLDYRIYFEFLPLAELHDTSKAVPLEGVRKGVNYAMIITTSNGLWRYLIGDTVEFTSTDPYRIRITGRTKHYMNAFGEEIVIDNAEAAIKAACDATGAVITEFTAAPIYMDGRRKGSHEWVVEYAVGPVNADRFRDVLDSTLQSLNSDYEAKRAGNVTLEPPVITVVPPGTFMKWMQQNGKEGGQNKVQRLGNDRKLVDELRLIASV